MRQLAQSVQAYLEGSAPATLMEGASAELPSELREQLPAAQAQAERNMDALNDALKPRLDELNRTFKRIQNPRTPRLHALGMLRDMAQIFSEAGKPHGACRAECTHCCHIPVAVSELEARLIGLSIGRRPQKVKVSTLLPAMEYGYNMPCTFLVNNRCSIYAYRPLACRTHLNMSDNEQLCQLIPDVLVPVPLANATSFQTAYAMLTFKSAMADIREFFPPQTEPVPSEV
jgi:Fe-S-cluster containining protein